MKDVEKFLGLARFLVYSCYTWGSIFLIVAIYFTMQPNANVHIVKYLLVLLSVNIFAFSVTLAIFSIQKFLTEKKVRSEKLE